MTRSVTPRVAGSGEPGIARGTASFRRVTVALFLGGFVTFANLYSAQPVLPLLAQGFAISPAHASLAVSVTTGALAACLPFTAHLSDRWGRKTLMLVAMGVSSLLSVAAAASPSFGVLLVARALQGAVLAGLPASAMAYLGDEVHPASAGFAVGLYISGTTVGGMAGRIVTGAVAGTATWRVAFAALGVICAACAACFWALLPDDRLHRTLSLERRRLRETNMSEASGASRGATRTSRLGATVVDALGPLWRHARDPLAQRLCAAAALLMGSFVPVYNYMGFQLLAPPYSVPPALVGGIFLTYLVGTFSAAWLGQLADRTGARRVLRASIMTMLAGALLTTGAPLAAKVGGLAVFTAGFFGAHAIASGWVARSAAADRAHASSLYLLCYYCGASLGGWAGGHFWLRFGWNGVAGMVALALAGALACTAGLPVAHRIVTRTAAGTTPPTATPAAASR